MNVSSSVQPSRGRVLTYRKKPRELVYALEGEDEEDGEEVLEGGRKERRK